MQSNNLFSLNPSDLQTQLDSALKELEANNTLPRLWQHDHTLWHPKPDDIANRLDWLELPDSMQLKLEGLVQFTRGLADEGFETAVLLGMGGSSLAPEVFKKTFGTLPGFLDLLVLDTTDPVTIRNTQESLKLDKTIFIVATKSGGTVETLSLFKYFFNLVDADPAIQSTGAHFIAITDPGSRLEKLATELSYRKIFLNNPNLGGRYSALSYFGLVPAACLGVDLPKLLSSAKSASQKNCTDIPAEVSPAAALGAFLAAAFNAGKDKLTFISSPEISSFSDWVEQLVAESTGKIGKGILPVVGEPVADDLAAYGNDRIFVIQQFNEDPKLETLAGQLKAAGFPVIVSRLQDSYQLGELILTWEMATAIAGHLIGIQPFDQPDVESAKVIARQSVQAYQETGELPERVIELASAEKINKFLEDISSHDYIALQAYLPSNPEIETVFRTMQAELRDRYKVAVTFGFGPRFLHSTGQLHKGDRGNGFFIQLVTTASQDLDIPDNPGKQDSGISFDTLKQAQAIGDGAALKSKNRKLIVLSINTPLLTSLTDLVESL